MAIAIVALSFALSLGAVELGFRLHEYLTHPVTSSKNYPAGFFQGDPDLGFSIRPGAVAQLHRDLRGKRVFNATYTMNQNSTRVTPGNPAGPTWLFVGCSYMFGEGVNDDQSLPSVASKELGLTANVVNIAVPGYGPHQVLRALEIDRLPGVTKPVKHVVFETIYEHVRRSSGRAPWDPSGPRYELDGDSVVYRGKFHATKGAWLILTLSKSAAMRYFLGRIYFGNTFSDTELETYGRIIERSAKLSREKLGADFTIVYWDDDDPWANKVLGRLKKTGLRLIVVSSVIPRSEWSSYRFPRDRHPNAKADLVLGRYVARALSRSE